MNTNYLFNVREWYGKFFTSESELHQAAVDGLINVVSVPNTYGSNYTYATKEGVVIASIYRDFSFGFGTQAYGVKVPSPIDMFPAVKSSHNDWCEKKGLQHLAIK